MSTNTATSKGVVFRVLDALDAPHSGRILRLRLQSGEAPTVRALRGATLNATAPDGRKTSVRVTGFSLIGGNQSNDRLARTGRVDVQVEDVGADGPVSLKWELTLG
jgi:hypothetical protein